MGTNHMEEIANMLGVTLNEEFIIMTGRGPVSYRLESDGLYRDGSIEGDSWNRANDSELLCLITGEITIRHDWKPDMYDFYWFINVNRINGETQFYPEESFWYGDFIDITMHKLGNCYRTKSAAISNIEKWKDFYYGVNKVSYE